MDDVKPTYDDEIDLIRIFETLWNGKWKIIGFVAVSLLGVFGYQTYQQTYQQQPLTFTATTEIKPITLVEAQKYQAFNAAVSLLDVFGYQMYQPPLTLNLTTDLNLTTEMWPQKQITSVEAQRYQAFNAADFFELSRDQLFSLYLEQLDERVFFEQAIREYRLLDVEEYDDEQAYNEAVLALASTIEILHPINIDDAERDDTRRYGTISVEYNDDEKWKKAISSVDSLVTQSVKSILQQRFQSSLSIARQKRDFDVEDLSVQIDNVRADYLRFMEDRLAFLIEQNEIAKKLDLAKSTFETQTFKALNNFITNVQSDTPYYLRGYDSISKEIELIQSRTNNDAFTPGLLSLEQKLRDLEQDKTLERVESLFASTPIASTNNFSAVSVNVETTDFEFNNNPMMVFPLPLAVVIGGVIGAFYVLISNAIRK